MAPFYFAHCNKCGRSTLHTHDWNEDQTKFWGVCDECGGIHVSVIATTYKQMLDEDYVAFVNRRSKRK